MTVEYIDNLGIMMEDNTHNVKMMTEDVSWRKQQRYENDHNNNNE